jgi:hypothetical protein
MSYLISEVFLHIFAIIPFFITIYYFYKIVIPALISGRLQGRGNIFERSKNPIIFWILILFWFFFLFVSTIFLIASIKSILLMVEGVSNVW